MNKPLFWVALLCLVMGGTICLLAWRRMQPVAEEVGTLAVADASYQRKPADASQTWLKEYTLVDEKGRDFHSKDLAGQVHVVSFFYSTCPGICLRMNTKQAEIAKEFGEKGVKFISISCDPEVDTPDKLRDYSDTLHADSKNWVFLTGGLPYLRRVGAEVYTVAVDKQTHVERFLVYDKWGNQRGQFKWNNPVETTEMKLLLTRLLAETEPPPDAAPNKLERRKRSEEEEAEMAEAAPTAANDTAATADASPAAAETSESPEPNSAGTP